MAKATSKYSAPIKQDVLLTEETPVTDQVENIEVIQATEVSEDLTQTPGVEELGTEEPAKVEEVIQPSDLDNLLAKVEAEGNPYRKGIIHTLNAYCVAMKPGKVIDPAEGARHHYQLWHGILSILDSCPEEEFRSTWNLILAYFNLNQNSALNDRFIFRFMHEWAQGNDQCKAYQHVINLIKLTMDPKQRVNGLKQVSLERSLTDVISEAGRAKLVSFYQV